MHTKDVLAAALEEAKLPEMAAKAREGYYHDYLSPIEAPGIQLARDLEDAGTPAADGLLKRHIKGDFDASLEEAEAWAESSEGKEWLRAND